jgi:hypothetical protein
MFIHNKDRQAYLLDRNFDEQKNIGEFWGRTRPDQDKAQRTTVRLPTGGGHASFLEAPAGE